MIYHCIQCSSNESNRKSNQFCVSTQNLSHISHTNADALHVLQDACSQGLFICNLFQWKNNKKWRTQFPFLPSQNIAATSETRTLQKNRIIIRGLVFHPSGSRLFLKTWMGFQSWFPGKSLRKKCVDYLVPAVDGGMAHVASRPRASRLLELSTISLFQWTLVGGKKGLWWIAGGKNRDFFWWPLLWLQSTHKTLICQSQVTPQKLLTYLPHPPSFPVAIFTRTLVV